jgi:protein phosphatase 1 regulatory subunit 7
MAISLDEIEAELESGRETTVQFDKPIGDTLLIVDPEEEDDEKWPRLPSGPYLERLDEMCARWGDRLTVRFYAHYSQVFDASTLESLPNVASLAADCLSEASNLEVIGELKRLSKLSLGVFELADKDILTKLPLKQLGTLFLTPTNSKAIDLTPLGEAVNLRKLYLEGHHRNIAALKALDGLEEFTFNAKRGLDLSFINGMTKLKALKFNLGGTESIEAIELPDLQDLAFTMTRGLAELGDLQRFPKLRRLLMQDQQHITRVRVGPGNADLEHLWFCNCKALKAIPGVEQCTSLKSIRWIFTDTDPAKLTLPASLTHLFMLSGKRKVEADEIAAIEALGYIASEHPGALFFYK